MRTDARPAVCQAKRPHVHLLSVCGLPSLCHCHCKGASYFKGMQSHLELVSEAEHINPLCRCSQGVPGGWSWQGVALSPRSWECTVGMTASREASGVLGLREKPVPQMQRQGWQEQVPAAWVASCSESVIGPGARDTSHLHVKSGLHGGPVTVLRSRAQGHRRGLEPSAAADFEQVPLITVCLSFSIC